MKITSIKNRGLVNGEYVYFAEQRFTRSIGTYLLPQAHSYLTQQYTVRDILPPCNTSLER